MSDVRPVSWQQVEQLSQEMAVLAEREEWELLLEKETERREVIDTFFAQPVSAEEAPAVASGIKALMAADKEMLSLFDTAREEVAQKMGTISTGRRMENAYSDQS